MTMMKMILTIRTKENPPKSRPHTHQTDLTAWNGQTWHAPKFESAGSISARSKCDIPIRFKSISAIPQSVFPKPWQVRIYCRNKTHTHTHLYGACVEMGWLRYRRGGVGGLFPGGGRSVVYSNYPEYACLRAENEAIRGPSETVRRGGPEEIRLTRAGAHYKLSFNYPWQSVTSCRLTVLWRFTTAFRRSAGLPPARGRRLAD